MKAFQVATDPELHFSSAVVVDERAIASGIELEAIGSRSQALGPGDHSRGPEAPIQRLPLAIGQSVEFPWLAPIIVHIDRLATNVTRLGALAKTLEKLFVRINSWKRLPMSR